MLIKVLLVNFAKKERHHLTFVDFCIDQADKILLIELHVEVGMLLFDLTIDLSCGSSLVSLRFFELLLTSD